MTSKHFKLNKIPDHRVQLQTKVLFGQVHL